VSVSASRSRTSRAAACRMPLARCARRISWPGVSTGFSTCRTCSGCAERSVRGAPSRLRETGANAIIWRIRQRDRPRRLVPFFSRMEVASATACHRLNQEFYVAVFPSAVLALADGTVFHGKGIGAIGTTVGEVVFNTSMTGYQEILTDPSYCQQIVTLTYPHIGNTGVNAEDVEADRVHAAGLVIRDLPLLTSNFRSERTL